MKSPAKPKRYGRRRSYKRPTQTQIIGRKRVPVDIGLDDEDVNISPLDERDAMERLKSEGSEEGRGDAAAAVRKESSEKGGEKVPSKSKRLRGSLVEYISPAPEVKKLIKSRKQLNPNEFDFFQQESSSHSNEPTNNKLPEPPFDASTKSHNTKASGASKKSTKSGNVTGASASTAKTKNTLRLAPRKKTPSRKNKKSPKRSLTMKNTKVVHSTQVGVLNSMKERKEVNHTLRLPENITIRTNKGEDIVNDVQVWEDEDVSVLTGATKKKTMRVLRDLGNRGNGVDVADKASKSMQADHPIKSPGKKRKSTSEQEHIEDFKKQRVVKKVDPCVIFTIPQYELGRYGEDRYQERKYLGLIEGIGGGAEEDIQGTDIPHRGRLLELPGELMPGAWKAQVLDEDSNGCSHKRISLRHHGAMYSSLEDHLYKEDEVPVVVINPLKYRVKSFIDQGVLLDEEFCNEVEDEEKVLGTAFLGCISLVWFDGFTSASDAVNLANETTEGLLKLCEPPNGKTGANDLCRLVQKGTNVDADESVGGILYRCRLEFDDAYSVLVSYNGFEIDAVDVVFKQIDAQTGISGDALDSHSRRGLTPSLISHHLDCVGSSVSDIMQRFKSGGAEDTYSYMPPVREKTADEKPKTFDEESVQTETQSEKSASSNKSLAGFGGDIDLFSNDDADTPAPIKPKVLQDDEVPAKQSEHIPAHYISAALEDAEKGEKQESEIVSGPVEKPAASTQNVTSAALEAVKERAYTTIQCQKDIDAVFEEACAGKYDPKIAQASTIPRALEDTVQVAQEHFGDAADKEKPLYEVNEIESNSIKVPNTSDTGQLKGSTTPSGNPAATTHVKLVVGANNDGQNLTKAKPVIKAKKTVKIKKVSRRLSYSIETKSAPRRTSAPPKLKSFQTPATAATSKRSSSAPKSSHRSINRDIFHGSSKHTSKKQLYSSTAKKSAAQKKEYICDLFGENESMFGIPTVKTPVTRRRSLGSATSRKPLSSALKSKMVAKSPDNSDSHQLPSVSDNLQLFKDSSPVVTPSHKAVAAKEPDDVFHSPIASSMVNETQSSFDFYDAPTDLFEETIENTPEPLAIGLQDPSQGYMSPQRFHDVYYGQGLQSPRATVVSPSNLAALMESPDRLRAFHDYYYGHEPYTNLEDDESATYFGQPLHDAYFGQYMDCEQLSLTEINISPDSSQAAHDIYFGQQDIKPIRLNLSKSSMRSLLAKKPRYNKQTKLSFVLLVISMMFQSAVEPQSSRQGKALLDIKVFTKTSPKTIFSVNEIKKQEHKAQNGWISSWYQGY